MRLYKSDKFEYVGFDEMNCQHVFKTRPTEEYPDVETIMIDRAQYLDVKRHISYLCKLGGPKVRIEES